MLKLSNVNTYYGDSHILHDVSLEVAKSSVVAILGRNGMGKTTTIRSIIGFTPARRGSVTFKGADITYQPSYKIARMGIGLVPQGRLIFPSLSVKENLTMPARTGSNNTWSLRKVYELFPILEKRAGLRGDLLSGGEQQMLCIGRALMTNPELLLMDEPSEGLAPLVIRELASVIKQLNSSGLSVLLVEQNFYLALSTASYIYILNKGTVAFHGTPQEIRSNEEVQTRYLGAAI